MLISAKHLHFWALNAKFKMPRTGVLLHQITEVIAELLTQVVLRVCCFPAIVKAHISPNQLNIEQEPNSIVIFHPPTVCIHLILAIAPIEQ